MPSADRRLRPRRTPQQVRAELTRERILTAAAQVFADHGYAAGTTNRIAERAHVSIGSLYQYFPNKDAILLELMSRHLDDGVAAAEPSADVPSGEPVGALVGRLVRASIDHHCDDPHLLQVLIEQAPRSARMNERLAEHKRSRVAALRRLLDDRDDVLVADSDTAARLVTATLELVVHQLVAAPDPVDPGRLEDAITAMLTCYLTGRPSAAVPGQD